MLGVFLSQFENLLLNPLIMIGIIRDAVFLFEFPPIALVILAFSLRRFHDASSSLIAFAYFSLSSAGPLIIFLLIFNKSD